MIGTIIAAKGFDFVDQVRTLDHDGASFRVTFWGNNRVYKVSKKSKAVACLQRAHMEQKEVALGFRKGDRIITNCRLFADKSGAR